MRLRTSNAWLVMIFIGLFSAQGLGATYIEVFPQAQLNTAGWTNVSHTATVVEGTTAYSHFAKTNTPRDFYIQKTTGLGGALSTSPVTTLATWEATAGALPNDRVFTGNGMAIVGSSIQIQDTDTDQVYRVDKTTGAASVYVNNAAITAAAGVVTGAATIESWSGVNNAGEAIFYEGTSKQILQTTGPGAASVLVDAAALGSAAPSSGLAVDPADNLYWGASGAGVYRRTSGGTISEIISQASLLSVLGGTGIGFSGDLFYAPNGLIYFRYGSSSNNQGIMSFNPADPATTLAVVLSRAELNAGPAATSTTGPFTWYNGNLGWSVFQKGFYALPEPGTLSLLALGGLLLRRRR